MFSNRIAFSCLILFLAITRVMAQNEAQFSQYWAIPEYINPGAVGLDNELRIAALDRMQWVGVTNAPKTFTLTAKMPLKLFGKTSGLGVMLLNDGAGLFSNTDFALQYAYPIQLKKGTLSLGLRVGATSQGFDGTKVQIPDTPDHNPSDESIPLTNVSGMAFDAGFGVYYNHPRFYTAFSAAHLSAPQIDLDEYSSIKLQTIYYLTAGCNISFRNPLYELHPSVLVKSTIQATQVDLTLRLLYNKMFWGGVSYRWKDAIIPMVGVQIKSVRVGYSYDYGTSAIAKASSGSHELFATYKFELKMSSKAKNKHKSIRIL